MKRQSGVLLPVFSLPGDYGCGNFGRSAYEWIDALKEGGFSLWQVLPFGVTDGHNSPYMSYSSFGGNLNFVDPEEVYRMGLVSREELEEQRVSDPYLCQYDRLRDTRYAFFKRAAGRIQDPAGIRAFFRKHPRLSEACRFFALKETNRGLPWREWTVQEPLPEDLGAWEFIQYLFHKQWDALHRYATLQGISIMGDLPFYVSYDSFDLWSGPEDFQLDARMDPTAVAGVPPDYFSEEGQLWGNPLYDWDAMERGGFVRFREKMEYMLSLFDGIRIDHFRAISAYWSVPTGAKSAKEGKWIKGPGKKLCDLIREIAGEKLIVAEDLGIIDDDTRKLLSYSKFPGMAVFQFGFDGNNLSPHLPHCYKENLVAYTGTHDNNTLLGFLWELDDEARKAALDYLGNPQDGCNAAIRALFMSRAGCVIFPVQDLLGYGADTRVNTPGNAAGNWAYRLTKEQMDSLDLPYWRHLNHIYAR